MKAMLVAAVFIFHGSLAQAVEPFCARVPGARCADPDDGCSSGEVKVRSVCPNWEVCCVWKPAGASGGNLNFIGVGPGSKRVQE